MYLAPDKFSTTLKMRIQALFFLLFIFAVSCKKEEEVQEPPRDVGEQALEDNNTLLDYFQSHTYNYEDFENNSLTPETTLLLDTLTTENDHKTPLIDLVQERKVDVFTVDGDKVEHTLYYLVARQGVGNQPSAVDSTFVAYEGSLLNGTVFDQRKNPIWFDLLQSIRGFREGMTALRAGTYTVNDDNTVNFDNFGQGVLFIPSGMGYFSTAQANIPAYSPLIFKVSLYAMTESDHDQDGVLTKEEYDNDNDGLPDDSDEDGIPDYLDKD